MMFWFFLYEDETARNDIQISKLEKLKNKHKIILSYTNKVENLICIGDKEEMKVQNSMYSPTGVDRFIEINPIWVINKYGDIMPGGIIR